MRILILLSLAMFAIVAGCGSESDDCADLGSKSSPYVGEPMFDRCAGMDIAVDRQAYSVGDTLTLAISFEPLFEGVASLSVWFLPVEARPGQSCVLVTAPSLVSSTGVLYTGPMTIDGTGRLEQPVSFVVRANTPYHITATVAFLQVRDPATGELLDIQSAEQVAALGRLDHTAYGTSTPLVLARPLVE